MGILNGVLIPSDSFSHTSNFGFSIKMSDCSFFFDEKRRDYFNSLVFSSSFSVDGNIWIEPSNSELQSGIDVHGRRLIFFKKKHGCQKKFYFWLAQPVEYMNKEEKAREESDDDRKKKWQIIFEDKRII